MPVGDKRGRRYVASEVLLEIRRVAHELRRTVDPYATIAQRNPLLPFIED